MRSPARSSLAAVLLIALLVSAAPGCGSSTDSTPAAVARKFVSALITRDASASFDLLSEKFKGEWGVTDMSWEPVMARTPIRPDATFTVRSATTDGDTATVTVLADNGEEGKVKLVREGGGWLVDYELGEWYGLAPGML